MIYHIKNTIRELFSIIINDKRLLFACSFFLVGIVIVAIFQPELVIGLLLIIFLSCILGMVMEMLGVGSKSAYLVFGIGVLVHVLAVLFIYYTGFRPFGGGADFEGYHQIAAELARRFGQGDFSLGGLHVMHVWPVLIGVLYMTALPSMIVGQLFVAFLSGCSILLVYFLARQIGATTQSAFLAALAAVIYPSYIFFGSVLLKDTLVIPLVLGGLLLTLVICRRLSLSKFIAFFLVLTTLIHLRFYVGFALMFSFIISWFLLSSRTKKSRLHYGLAMIIVLGFSPLILGYGYFGSTPLVAYLDKDVITKYREVVYAPSPDFAKKNEVKKINTEECLAANNCPTQECAQCVVQKPGPGNNSSFTVSVGFDSPIHFTKNYILSFIYSLLGPFPWQLKLVRHLFFLPETIPWYLLWGFFVVQSWLVIKKQGFKYFLTTYRYTLPLVLFCIIAFGALSLYINNFGIIIRIRIPMVLVLLAVASLSANNLPDASQRIQVAWQKIFRK